MADEELSPNMQVLVKYLTDSLMLSTPLIENDPAYTQLKDAIPSIIHMTLLSMGKTDAESLTPRDTQMVIFKSLQTLYLRLATMTAPEFDVSAEQVSFKKGDRFFHYTELAKQVAEQIEKLENTFVEVADVRISSRNGTLRNYNLAVEQETGFKANAITEHSVELEWNRFNLMYGEFYAYTLMYADSPIYDEYAVPKLRDGNDIVKFDFFDIRRTKLRLMDLESGTVYYVLLIFKSRDGLRTYKQIEVETFAEIEDEEAGEEVEP